MTLAVIRRNRDLALEDVHRFSVVHENATIHPINDTVFAIDVVIVWFLLAKESIRRR